MSQKLAWPADGAEPRRHAISLLNRRNFWRDALRRRILALADALAAIIASVFLSVGSGAANDVQLSLWAAVFVPAWLLFAKLYGLYDRDHIALRHLTVDELPTIFLWALTCSAALAVFLHATPADALTISEAARTCGVAAASAFLLRALGRLAWRRLTPPERTLILGQGPLADAAKRKFELFPDIHVRTVAEADVDEEGLALLERAGAENAIDRVVVATPAVDERLIAQLIEMCRDIQAKLSLVPPLRGLLGSAATLSHIADLPVVEYNTWHVSRSTLLLKRAVDFTIGSVVFAALSPLFLPIGLAILVDSGGPVFFSQVRVGQHGRRFRVLKFRTMVSNAEELLPGLVALDRLQRPMFKLRRDPRATRVGRFLRRTSLDELPQLVNVLRGHMSLVGPRPEQVELVERYGAEERFRLAVKPGLTGPMQVYGRGRLTFDERLAVERDYIENMSLWRDLRILTLTLPAVFGGRGAF
jgi:exopolysaccharide biosynthesis polyprenyl glycosylphosphotransferase